MICALRSIGLELVACATVLAVVVAEDSKQWTFDTRPDSFTSYSVDRSNRYLAHVTCMNWHTESNKLCDVNVENLLAASNSEGKNRTCQVRYNVTDVAAALDFAVVPVDAEHVVLVHLMKFIDKTGSYIEDSNLQDLEWFLNLRIVQMSSCTYKNHKVPVDRAIWANEVYLWVIPIIVYADRFDLFVQSKAKCHQGICKLTYSLDGRLIDDAISFLPDESLDAVIVSPVATNTSSRGYFVYSGQGEDRRISWIDPTGASRKTLAILPGGQITSAGISNFENLFGICTVPWDRQKMRCLQVDPSGNLLIDKELEFAYNVTDSRIQNLPNGGFLLLTTTLKRFTREVFVSQVSPNGKVTGPLELRHITPTECDIHLMKKLYLFDDEFVYVCMQKKKTDSKIKLIEGHFTKDLIAKN